MKTYLANNYTNFESFVNDVNQDLAENVQLPISIVHKTLGTCTITGLRASVNEAGSDIVAQVKVGSDLIAQVQLEEGQVKQYSLRITLANGIIVLDDATGNLIQNYLAAMKEVQAEIAAIKKEESRLKAEAYLKEKEAERERAKEAAREAKLQAKLRELKPEDYLRSYFEPTTQYELLGWITKHVKTITPTVPKSMLSWFTNRFGVVENCSVADDSKKTVGGHAMKWNMSFKASFDSEVPEALSSRASKNNKAINDVSFIWGLIDKYGFQFGKKQDIEKIRATIPTTYLPQFEKGFAV
jgi:hypothetical protein